MADGQHGRSSNGRNGRPIVNLADAGICGGPPYRKKSADSDRGGRRAGILPAARTATDVFPR